MNTSDMEFINALREVLGLPRIPNTYGSDEHEARKTRERKKKREMQQTQQTD